MVGIEPTYDKQTLLTTRFTLCLCLTLIRIMPLVDVVGIEPTLSKLLLGISAVVLYFELTISRP